jgi:hypothetical protein
MVLTAALELVGEGPVRGVAAERGCDPVQW